MSIKYNFLKHAANTSDNIQSCIEITKEGEGWNSRTSIDYERFYDACWNIPELKKHRYIDSDGEFTLDMYVIESEVERSDLLMEQILKELE